MDVQMNEQMEISGAPLGRLVVTRGIPMLRVRRTVELHKILCTLVELGVQRLGFHFRFHDDGDVTWQFTSRGVARGRSSGWPAINEARQLLRQLLEDAIRAAAGGVVGYEQELHYDCELVYSRDSRTWQLGGSGAAYKIDPEFWDVGISLE